MGCMGMHAWGLHGVHAWRVCTGHAWGVCMCHAWRVCMGARWVCVRAWQVAGWGLKCQVHWSGGLLGLFILKGVGMLAAREWASVRARLCWWGCMAHLGTVD